MALRFLEPITAPTPVRPALRDQSPFAHAKRTSFSPPTPMEATCTSCVPRRSLMRPSASRQVLPASSGNGTIEAFPSSTNRNDITGALPVMSSTSTPACRSSMPKPPPIDESP